MWPGRPLHVAVFVGGVGNVGDVGLGARGFGVGHPEGSQDRAVRWA
jgi:hypothetical protein